MTKKKKPERKSKYMSVEEILHRGRHLPRGEPVPQGWMDRPAPDRPESSMPVDLSGLEDTGVHLFDKDTPTEDIVRILRERAAASKQRSDDSAS